LLSPIQGQVALGRTTGRWDELFNTQDRRTQDRVDVVVWVVPLVLAIDQPAPKRYCFAVLGDQLTYQANLIGIVALGMIKEDNAVESP